MAQEREPAKTKRVRIEDVAALAPGGHGAPIGLPRNADVAAVPARLDRDAGDRLANGLPAKQRPEDTRVGLRPRSPYQFTRRPTLPS